MTPFDPDAAALPGSGIYGLPHAPEQAVVHVLGVPFDATTSYRRGTAAGPEAVLAASHQVDLFDRLFGRPYEAGLCYLPDDGSVAALNEEARALATPVIEAAGVVAGDPRLEAALARVNAVGEQVNGIVRARTEAVLDAGRLPAILGGDHSVPFGAIAAAAERVPGLGVLHFDAHADLRDAFEGFRWSHASIFHNVLEHTAVARLVQVGVRDLGAAEAQRSAEDPRVATLFDDQWAAARVAGADLRALVREHLALLPQRVWISFDVDGLEPDLCPNTGTPVPGGLDWHGAMLWLEELVASGRQVVGLDLCEVSPGAEPDPNGEGWDAVVGARLLYRLVGAALSSFRKA